MGKRAKTKQKKKKKQFMLSKRVYSARLFYVCCSLGKRRCAMLVDESNAANELAKGETFSSRLLYDFFFLFFDFFFGVFVC